MILNKIKSYIPVAVAVLTMGTMTTSCTKDLDVENINPQQTSKLDQDALLNKIYSSFVLTGQTGPDGNKDIQDIDEGRSDLYRKSWEMQEFPTGEASWQWDDTGLPELLNKTWGADNASSVGLYYRLFFSITLCNYYLDEVEDDGSTDAKQKRAEVRFIRSLLYYNIMDLYGNAAFVEHVSTEPGVRYTRPDYYKYIESELLAIDADLAAPGANQYGRVDKVAAWLLLSRLYLNAEVYTGTARWEDAKTYAEKVINGPHKLWTTGTGKWSAYQMLFMGDNGESGASQEAILPLYQDGVTTTSWGTSLFLMASCWKADMDTDNDYGTDQYWAGNRARSQFIAKFFPNNDAPKANIADMVKAAGDDRALFFGKGRDLVVETTSEYTSGYAVGKFRNTYSNGGNPHNSKFVDTDYFLMRSAEAYLIAAEADARLNGGKTTATGKGYIDALRQRANNNDLKESYDLNQILDERARELYYEGFRRTDLIRCGYYGGEKSGEYLWEWKGGIKNGQAIAAYLNLFAIPAKDMNANPKLKGHQNPGY